MKRSNDSKALAAYELADEILKISLSLERAEAALQEITDTFFNDFDFLDGKDKISMLVGMHVKRYEPFAFIVSDYLFKIRKVVSELKDLEAQGSIKRKTAPEAVTSKSGA